MTRQQQNPAPGIEAEIQAVLDSSLVSYWLKDALRAAMSRDCVDAARDAEQLASLLDRRAADILGLWKSKETTEDEVVAAVDAFHQAMGRHLTRGGAHPFDHLGRQNDRAAMAVYELMIEFVRAARHYHDAPDGSPDYCWAHRHLLDSWQGVKGLSLRDFIAEHDNPAALVGRDLLELISIGHATPPASPPLLSDLGLLALVAALHSWRGAPDRVEAVYVEYKRWSLRPSQRVLPSVSILTTDRTAALIAEKIQDADTTWAWRLMGRHMPRSTWREDATGMVPVWTLAVDGRPGWRCRREEFMTTLASDVDNLTTVFERAAE